MQKKILNSRPIVLFGIVMLATIFVVLYANFASLKIAITSVSAVLAILFALLAVFIKSKMFRYVATRISIFGLAIICGVASVFVHEIAYSKDNFEFSGNAVISGTIYEVGSLQGNDYRTVILDDVTIVAPKLEKHLTHKASIVVICDESNPNTFIVGKRVDVYGKINSASLYYVGSNGLTFYYYCHDISCYGYATEANVHVTDDTQHLSLSQRVKLRAEELVGEGVDEEYLGLALGMLFGDRAGVEPEISESFSAAGISHLLAVSGLHVGFLMTLLVLIAKLIRVKGLPKFLLISGILIFYAYLCGFTVSVTRAAIMCICHLYASCRYKKYDSFNALAMALIIVLLINPFSCTTVGFKLSFGCVLGIILLAPGLTKVFGKLLKPKMAQTLAVLVSVQVAVIAIQITAFKNISLVALVSNFICLPVASLAYMLLFVTLSISFILPFMAFSIYLFQFVMQVAVKFVFITSKVSVLHLAPWKGSAILGVQLPAMYMSSNYLFGGGYIRKIITCLLWLAVVVILFV